MRVDAIGNRRRRGFALPSPGAGRLGSVVLGCFLAACTGSHVPSSTATSTAAPLTDEVQLLVDGADQFTVVVEGTGTGPDAERLVENRIPGVIPGTVTHVATLHGAGGPTHFVVYQAADPGLLTPDVVWCVAELSANGRGAGCGERSPLNEPTLGGVTTSSDPRSGTTAWAYGGVDAHVAIMTTESGHTIAIITANGFAASAWPSAWGLPTRVRFHDEKGETVFEDDFNL